MARRASPYNRGMEAEALVRGLGFGSRVEGSFRPAGSKSIAQRALVAAALCAGPTRIEGAPEADDVNGAVDWAYQVTAARRWVVPSEPGNGAGRVVVRGFPPGPRAGLAPAGPVTVFESGTLARLATAAHGLAGLPGARVRIDAEGSLLTRSSAPLFACLARAGCEIEHLGRADGWPAHVRAVAPREGELLVLENPVSSQEVSGLLIALAAHEGAHALRVVGTVPSRPYVDITRRLLARFGVDARCDESENGALFTVRGPLRAPTDALAIEPDASSAAVALCVACLSNGSAGIMVPGLGLDSLQGDVRVVEHLRAFGCDARATPDALIARGVPTRGADLDLSGEPDLAPPLAALAAAAALAEPGAPSRLRGLGTLRGKESDRIAALVAGLDAIGLCVEANADSIAVVAPAREPHRERVVVDARGDHRIAFFGALLGLVRPEVYVADSRCVSKSWPRFWEDLEKLGARLVAP